MKIANQKAAARHILASSQAFRPCNSRLAGMLIPPRRKRHDAVHFLTRMKSETADSIQSANAVAV